jgi:ADP-ribose pyrophosphatase YjhB (NUDIX family)
MKSDQYTQKGHRQRIPEAYFVHAAWLPHPEAIDYANIFAFYKGKALLTEDLKTRSLRLPYCVPEPSEPLYQTFRREVFKQTGAVLEYSNLIGHFSIYKTDKKGKNYSTYVPVYVGKIAHFEREPVSKKTGLELLVSIGDALKRLLPACQKINEDYFLSVLRSYLPKYEKDSTDSSLRQ